MRLESWSQFAAQHTCSFDLVPQAALEAWGWGMVLAVLQYLAVSVFLEIPQLVGHLRLNEQLVAGSDELCIDRTPRHLTMCDKMNQNRQNVQVDSTVVG